MTEYESFVEEVAKWLCGTYDGFPNWENTPDEEKQVYRKEARSLLSLEHEGMRLAVVRKEGRLPENPFKLLCPDLPPSPRYFGYADAQHDILKANYVQAVRSE